MENTVDLILRHGDRDPQILVRQLQSGVDPEQSIISADEELARQLSRQPAAATMGAPSSASSSSSSSAGRGKGTPTTLPDDFLRIPGAHLAGSSLQDDEALARMLQDELFSAELSRNPDFAHLARAGGRGSIRRSSAGGAPHRPAQNPFAGIARHFSGGGSQQQQRSAPSSSASAAGAAAPPPSPNVMEKLSELGDNAKRRLQMLAAQFNANQARGGHRGPPPSSPGGAASGERRGLLDGDDHDDMELAARKDL
jgi:hypothetical protein